MKLNPDCVRDILLAVEAFTLPGKTYCMGWQDFKKLPGLQIYTVDEIAYHVQQCYWSEFFANAELLGASISFSDIGPKAHEFLAHIRTEENWKKTKAVCGKLGNFALSTIESVSEGIAKAAITSFFGV